MIVVKIDNLSLTETMSLKLNNAFYNISYDFPTLAAMSKDRFEIIKKCNTILRDSDLQEVIEFIDKAGEDLNSYYKTSHISINLMNTVSGHIKSKGRSLFHLTTWYGGDSEMYIKKATMLKKYINAKRGGNK